MFDELLAASRSALRGVDTYLSLDENQFAQAAVTRLHAHRGSATHSGSITLIHGAAGIGKTHLARWTLAELTRKHPCLKFVYASVQDLCELMQLADERQSLAEFLENCQSLDLIVCEDIHWLETSPFSQPWFVMLIETLEMCLTQVLITSRKPVGEIRPLDQRLVSRCHGGLCVQLPILSHQSRVKLVTEWFQELQRSLIDVKYLEQWLEKSNRTPRLSFDAIVVQVADEFGVEPNDIRSRSRQQGLAVPRQCAMWLARELTGRPLEQIGQYFDRSHTTVSHSLTKLNELMPSAPSLRQQLQRLRQQLKELPPSTASKCGFDDATYSLIATWNSERIDNPQF